jgi:hypothetical protein
LRAVAGAFTLPVISPAHEGAPSFIAAATAAGPDEAAEDQETSCARGAKVATVTRLRPLDFEW